MHTRRLLPGLAASTLITASILSGAAADDPRRRTFRVDPRPVIVVPPEDVVLDPEDIELTDGAPLPYVPQVLRHRRTGRPLPAWQRVRLEDGSWITVGELNALTNDFDARLARQGLRAPAGAGVIEVGRLRAEPQLESGDASDAPELGTQVEPLVGTPPKPLRTFSVFYKQRSRFAVAMGGQINLNGSRSGTSLDASQHIGTSVLGRNRRLIQTDLKLSAPRQGNANARLTLQVAGQNVAVLEETGPDILWRAQLSKSVEYSAKTKVYLFRIIPIGVTVGTHADVLATWEIRATSGGKCTATLETSANADVFGSASPEAAGYRAELRAACKLFEGQQSLSASCELDGDRLIRSRRVSASWMALKGTIDVLLKSANRSGSVNLFKYEGFKSSRYPNDVELFTESWSTPL